MTVGAPATLAELCEGAVPFRLRLNARFRGVGQREGWLIQGPSGWGEFAPFDDYPPALAARWLRAAIDAAWGSAPTTFRDSVPVNAIIPAADERTVRDLAQAAVERGCTTMKVKVATGDSAADIARVAAVRDTVDALCDTGRIRLDANAAWTFEQAQKVLPLLVEAAGRVEYVEQPCAALVDCARVRHLGHAPVAVDEGVRLAADLEDEALWREVRDAADVVIVKPIPLGGIDAVLRVAQRAGRPLVVSGSLDSSVGLMYSVLAAAALPDLPFACGLGTGALLADDLVTSTVMPHAGVIAPHRLAPDPDLLVAHRMDDADPRLGFWRQRIADAAAHLPGFGSVEP